MSKIGVGVGDEFPVEDSSQRRETSGEGEPAQADQPQRTTDAEQSRSEAEDRCGFEHWKWRREGECFGQGDVQNERAQWEAKKRAFKEKIRAAVHDAWSHDEKRHHHSRTGFWPIGAFGIGIAALALALHRHGPVRRPGGGRYYDDSDIETPPRSRRATHTDGGGPIITPPPSRKR